MGALKDVALGKVKSESAGNSGGANASSLGFAISFKVGRNGRRVDAGTKIGTAEKFAAAFVRSMSGLFTAAIAPGNIAHALKAALLSQNAPDENILLPIIRAAERVVPGVCSVISLHGALIINC